MTKQGNYDTMEATDIRERLKAEIMSLTDAQLEYVLEVLKHGEDFMRDLVSFNRIECGTVDRFSRPGK